MMTIPQETRREAYTAILPKMSRKEQGCLYVLRSQGPMTAEEIMAVLHTQNHNNVRPRLTALHQRGLIRAAGKKRVSDGHNATIWEAARIEKAAPRDESTESGAAQRPTITPSL